MAQVAKSTITPIGPVKMISKINAAGRIALDADPGAGLVRWQSVIGPPKMLAQEVQNKQAAKDRNINCFFMD
jgi:hypothetical protein